MYFNEGWESSDTEIDMLLVDMPMDLIKESLKYQIINPLSTNVNYIETVVDKIRLLKRSYSEDSETLKAIDTIVSDFFGFLITEINRRYDVGINTEDYNASELTTIGITLYDFFILRYKKNITKFTFKFIIKNKKVIVEEFSKFGKKKDVTSISLKKMTKNKDDVLIISNLPSIIKYIINLDLDSLDFLEYAASSDDYNANYIKKLVKTDQMTGNWVKPYLSLVTDEYDYVLDELQTDIRYKILKKMKVD